MESFAVFASSFGLVTLGFTLGHWAYMAALVKDLSEVGAEWRAVIADVQKTHNAQVEQLAALSDRLGFIEMQQGSVRKSP